MQFVTFKLGSHYALKLGLLWKSVGIKPLALRFWNYFAFELFKSNKLGKFISKQLFPKVDARNNFKTTTMATAKDKSIAEVPPLSLQ